MNTPHCASATRRLALDNMTYSAQLANTTHTRCRPSLSWMGARWPSGLERREVGEGWREGGRDGWREGGRDGWREGGREGGRERQWREGASVEEGRVKGRVDEGNERGKDRTRHGRRDGNRGGRKWVEEGLSEKGREYGSKGGRETSREAVYSQTNHSQTGPCPWDLGITNDK